nr:hypothetical protein [Tanacetum cinerariifolium]
RQVVPTNYFINNDLEYLKGGSSSSKYVNSTTRAKAAKIITVTSVKVIRWYDYGYLGDIVVQRNDNVLYKFKEGDFPRLNLCDIEDMLLLLVQKKLSNVDLEDRQNQRDLPRDIPLDNVVVLRYEKRTENPVKEILLKLNLPDHRSILTDSKKNIKIDMEVPGSSKLTRFIATCSYSTDVYKDIMKAQVHVSRLLLL